MAARSVRGFNLRFDSGIFPPRLCRFFSVPVELLNPRLAGVELSLAGGVSTCSRLALNSKTMRQVRGSGARTVFANPFPMGTERRRGRTGTIVGGNVVSRDINYVPVGCPRSNGVPCANAMQMSRNHERAYRGDSPARYKSHWTRLRADFQRARSSGGRNRPRNLYGFEFH